MFEKAIKQENNMNEVNELFDVLKPIFRITDSREVILPPRQQRYVKNDIPFLLNESNDSLLPRDKWNYNSRKTEVI
ncbi:MAG: hypothetical protein CMO34_01900 [Verrucomicrobia bacterium]|nr:hypothetical protein [Verrucomicrobiota bacterium]